MTNVPHHIIAIGASAGGLEELNLFFDHTPLDSVSYVIVQHLSSDFKSRMVEIVARHSKLEVKEAGNEMLVETNKVYIIPHDKFMTISNNKFFLTDKAEIKGPHLTINTFFNSLAADAGKRAIAIVLSGLGSDGSEGIKAIKSAGGMVIARNPETSDFNSMPSNAIKTGVVDYVLEPAAMPDIIEDFLKKSHDHAVSEEEDEKTFSEITRLVKEHSSNDFSAYKQGTILRRLKRRAEFNNCDKPQDYLDFLRLNPEELDKLTQDFLISVTSFFRDKNGFEFMREEVIPDIIKQAKPGEEIKIWVAGCATGEEAYSLAILFAEQLTGEFKGTVLKIFATDIDAIAIEYGRRGNYAAAAVKDVSPERLERFFVKEGENYRVITEIRNMVIFSQHDLVKNPPYCNMQLISCRNVLIYMTPVLQKKVLLMLLFGLKVDGYLFLGSSENPVPIAEHLETLNKKWKIYKTLETKRVIHFDGFLLPQMVDIKDKRALSLKENISANTSHNLTEAVNNSLVKDRNALVVCVDSNNKVIKTYGDTTKYLLQKNFNSDLTELLPRPLAVAYTRLSIESKKTDKSASLKGIRIKQGETQLDVTVTVSSIYVEKGVRLLLVTFSEDHSLLPAGQDEAPYDEKKYNDQYTLVLEEELTDLKDKLQSTYEQLDLSNDNMQSYNEELLSANEEMQSTNEEMQSINEELHTINTDYQLKNKELQETNDDLNNYFRSNINGQLFVNKKLELMKFSPGTVELINLLPTDIGRPLSNISTNIKLETIVEDIKKVIMDGGVITKEIEASNGKWFQVMTMAYLQADNSTHGAIITFNDINELKKIQVELDKKNISLLHINADLDNFVHISSHDLLAPLSNIQMSIDVMNSIEVPNPELNKYLTIINSSITKFRSLINDISAVAKRETGLLNTEMIDMDDVINDIEWSLENKIKATHTQIKRDFKIKKIRFSKSNLRSILFNLISNSIKFKRDERLIISISSEIVKDSIFLTVEDNGIGIDKQDLSRIFDMYQRLNYEIEGHGIGLYLVKKIINAANGNIVAESEPGKGSKFIINLKLEPEIAIAPVALN